MLNVLGKKIGEREVRIRFFRRLSEGKLTRDENPESHFSTFLVAYRKGLGGDEILIGYHKKADRYLPNGGHLDFLKDKNRAETCEEAAQREADEELDVKDANEGRLSDPFWISYTPIYKSDILCREHFDVWFAIDVTGVDVLFCDEFDHMIWTTFDVAISMSIDDSVIDGLKALKKILG